LLENGGNIGDNVSAPMGLLFIPARNALIWVGMATVAGMIIGSVTFLLKVECRRLLLNLKLLSPHVPGMPPANKTDA
jgi:hypothetical protein